MKQFRDRFVNFEGKRSLEIVAKLCNLPWQGVKLTQISGNIRYPSMADWLLPAFTTTAEENRIIHTDV